MFDNFLLKRHHKSTDVSKYQKAPTQILRDLNIVGMSYVIPSVLILT